MGDLLVTGIGTMICYIVLIIDKFNNFKLCHWLNNKIDQENDS